MATIKTYLTWEPTRDRLRVSAIEALDAKAAAAAFASETYDLADVHKTSGGLMERKVCVVRNAPNSAVRVLVVSVALSVADAPD